MRRKKKLIDSISNGKCVSVCNFRMEISATTIRIKSGESYCCCRWWWSSSSSLHNCSNALSSISWILCHWKVAFNDANRGYPNDRCSFATFSRMSFFHRLRLADLISLDIYISLWICNSSKWHTNDRRNCNTIYLSRSFCMSYRFDWNIACSTPTVSSVVYMVHYQFQ